MGKSRRRLRFPLYELIRTVRESRSCTKYAEEPLIDAPLAASLSRCTCGYSQTLLYNEERPHGAIGHRPPMTLHNHDGDPNIMTKIGKL